MIILAIDSSGASASAAVTDGEKLLSLFVTSSPQKHSATLMPMVESALKAAGKNVAEVDLFAGTVIALGRRHGVPTPVNQALFDLIKALQAQHRPADIQERR